MLMTRQVVLFEQLLESPLKPWHIGKRVFLLSYIAACAFLDIVLLTFLGLAAIPIAAFEVALIVAFPKIERWIKNY